MRDHFEGTRYDATAGPGANPHFQGERPICHSATLFSVVARLRKGVPLPLRACLWVAFGRPDTTPFTPWYPAMTAVPDGFHNTPEISAPEDAMAHHFDPVPGTYDPDTSSAFWIFKNYADRVNADYHGRISAASEKKRLIEERMFALGGEIEKQAILLDGRNPEKTAPYLTRHAADAAAWAKATLKAALQGMPPDPGM
jgi:dipeptidase